MQVVAVAPDTIVFMLTVSGTEGSELVGLDASTGELRWRQKAGFETSSGTADRKGAFYVVNANTFQKRDIRTGSVLWQTNLFAVPRQGTVSKTLRERWAEAKAFILHQRTTAAPPNSFQCPAPVVFKDRVFLARDALTRGGCVYSLHFSDWLVFDSAKGNLINSGAGAFAGCTETTAFCVDNRQIVTAIGDGKLIGRPQLVVSNAVSPYFTTYEPAHSTSGRALISGEKNGCSAASLVDSAGNEIAWFPGLASDWLTGWALVPNGVLRYSIRDLSEHTGGPFVELLNFKGQSVARREVVIGSADDWYLRCQGITKAGMPVFCLKSHVFLLALPSLQPSPLAVQHFSGADTDERNFDDDFHVDADSELVFHVSGNAMLYKMHQPSEAHEIVIRALDPGANRVMWSYREPTVIKKFQ